jgi:hypothetical protein
VVNEKCDKNVSETTWLRNKNDEQCFSDHVVIEKSDGEYFGGYVVDEKCFRNHIVNENK